MLFGHVGPGRTSSNDEQVQTMNIEEKRVVVEPTEVLEDILLDESNLERYTRVEADMEKK